MVFDDVHLSMEDAVFVRDSATRFFGALAASDRVSLNTTSGQLTPEFTDDHGKLAKALLGITPRPLTGAAFHDCPDVSYYQADLIVNSSRQDNHEKQRQSGDAGPRRCHRGYDPMRFRRRLYK